MSNSFTNRTRPELGGQYLLALLERRYGSTMSSFAIMALMNYICQTMVLVNGLSANLSLLLLLLSILFFITTITLYLKLKKAGNHPDIHDATSSEEPVALSNNNLSDTDSISPCRLRELLFEIADDGIAIYDDKWKMIYANPAFYSLIGVAPEQYDAASADSLLHPDDSEFPAYRKKCLTEKDVCSDEIRIKHKNGHYVVLNTKAVKFEGLNGGGTGFLVISRDVTAIKQVYDDLLKSKEEAEQSSRLKASFMANISHEIRTPLNSVVGFANLLLDNNITSQIKAEYVEQINYNSEKLLQIIGDIIDLSRLENSQIEISYEETSIRSVVKEVEKEIRNSVNRQEKPILVGVQEDFSGNSDLVFTDSVWLKRVLNHLMDNAVKFTLEGRVDLNYGIADSRIFFSVKDTGIGIRQENIETIFEGFRQEVDGHHRPFEGLGVGLTLVREVVEKMGGEVKVTSKKGIGSEFIVTLPHRAAGSIRKSAKLPDQTVPADWSSKKCLIVDDNRDVIVYLNRLLIDTGLQVVTARSGNEALMKIEQEDNIDLVLLDMQMPGMNGIETAREIRRIKGDIPIIAQTAFIFEDDKDLILHAGCDACLIKPIRKDQLLAVLGSFL